MTEENTSATITEALARIVLIDKKIRSKQDKILRYLAIPENMKDPLGDSKKEIEAELQSINDLLKEKVKIRKLIIQSNLETDLTINGKTMPVQGWLIWRRDILPVLKEFYVSVLNRADAVRNNKRPDDKYIINVDELKINNDLTEIISLDEELDGMLSLNNATKMISW